MRSLDIAGTGMQAQQTNVEVISNNIANMTTTASSGGARSSRT
jgi:flagellar basal-body rod protein FlgG